MPLALFAQIGINTTDPKTTLDVNGALALREGAPIGKPPTNAINDLDLGAVPHTVYRIEGNSADFTISGIIPAVNVDGQLLVLVNGTSGKMTVLNNQVSIPANRIYVPGGKDLRLTGNFSTLMLLYSDDLKRWVVLNKSSHIEVRTYTLTTLLPTGASTQTLPVTEATPLSSASVSFVGPYTESISRNLYIDYVEVRNGEVVFRVRNETGAPLGVLPGNPVQFAIIINLI